MVVKSLQKFKNLSKIARNNSCWALFRALLLITFYSSCSLLKIPDFFFSKEDIFIDPKTQLYNSNDVEDHLASLKKSFINTPRIRMVKKSKNDEEYLTSIIQNVLNNNEIFFKQLKRAEVEILDMNNPLHFSLPKGAVFLTKGLITKYIKHESVLAAIISYELIKSEKILYPRQTFIPLGFIDLENIVQMNRLALDESLEVHKWAYHLLRRSGYDGEYYLYWLQTQNRNTADFIMQFGDINQINREESLFKSFLIREAKRDGLPQKSLKTSSKNFYRFINRLRDNGNEIRAI